MPRGSEPNTSGVKKFKPLDLIFRGQIQTETLPKKFVRETPGVLDQIPGSEPGVMSATAFAKDDKGHWIGGQLLVETVLSELKVILAAAAQAK